MIRNYIIIDKIGKGTFGIVYKVKKYNDPLTYVIKQISLEGLTDFQINQVLSEAKILSLIKSNHVVKYYESFMDKNDLIIVMEYCDNGDLCHFLEYQKIKYEPLSEDLILQMFIKITLGLASIHKMKILHRDLKSLNIFLNKNMDVKIGDLGVAKELNQDSFANTVIGTPYYLSPEMCEDKPYNEKSDVWALGCILYELCTFRHPFNATNQAALIMKIMHSTPEPIFACYSQDLQNLINIILEKDFQKRPTSLDILNCPFIIDKSQKLGLYQEIVELSLSNNYIQDINNLYVDNFDISSFPLDSEDVLRNSHLIGLNNKYNRINVKKLDNNYSSKTIKKSHTYINQKFNKDYYTFDNNQDAINRKFKQFPLHGNNLNNENPDESTKESISNNKYYDFGTYNINNNYHNPLNNKNIIYINNNKSSKNVLPNCYSQPVGCAKVTKIVEQEKNNIFDNIVDLLDLSVQISPVVRDTNNFQIEINTNDKEKKPLDKVSKKIKTLIVNKNSSIKMNGKNDNIIIKDDNFKYKKKLVKGNNFQKSENMRGSMKKKKLDVSIKNENDLDKNSKLKYVYLNKKENKKSMKKNISVDNRRRKKHLKIEEDLTDKKSLEKVNYKCIKVEDIRPSQLKFDEQEVPKIDIEQQED